MGNQINKTTTNSKNSLQVYPKVIYTKLTSKIFPAFSFERLNIIEICFNLSTIPRRLVVIKKFKKLSKKLIDKNKLSYWNTSKRYSALNYLNSPDTNKNETKKFHVSLKYIAWLCDKLEGKT